MLAQLKISQPPAFAVISPDGKVYQEYTGWISEKVMSQVVANALGQVAAGRAPPDIRFVATPPPGGVAVMRHDPPSVAAMRTRARLGVSPFV